MAGRASDALPVPGELRIHRYMYLDQVGNPAAKLDDVKASLSSPSSLSELHLPR